MDRFPAEGPIRAVTIYYGIAIPITLFFACSGQFKSTVCGPNFDVLVSFLYVLIACIGVFFQLQQGVVNKAARTQHFKAAGIHFGMLILLLGLLGLSTLW